MRGRKGVRGGEGERSGATCRERRLEQAGGNAPPILTSNKYVDKTSGSRDNLPKNRQENKDFGAGPSTKCCGG